MAAGAESLADPEEDQGPGEQRRQHAEHQQGRLAALAARSSTHLPVRCHRPERSRPAGYGSTQACDKFATTA
jgi:hypothetical protein